MKFHFQNVFVSALAHATPPLWMTSTQIEERLQPLYERLRLPEGRLELMTGIARRGFWPTGTRSSEIAVQAGQLALQRSQIAASEVDVLIHASVCRDFLEPATAAVVHHQLGMQQETLIYDLSNACLGVLNAMVVAAQGIELGQYEVALIVSGENSGPLLEQTIAHLLQNQQVTRQELKKYLANFTIGSAGFAIVLTHRNYVERQQQRNLHLHLPHPPAQFLGGAACVDTSQHHLCQGDGNLQGLMMETDSEKMLEWGVALAAQTWRQTKAALGWQNSTPHHIFPHQVGIFHQRQLYQKLELDIQKNHATFHQWGNTGSAAVGLTWSEAWELGRLREGEVLALLGIGSGLSSIMIGVQW